MEEIYSTMFWTICLVALVFLIYWRGVASFSLLKDLPIPGPRQWPYVGNLPDVVRFGGMHNMLWEYFQRYGRVYKMGFGRRPTIVVTDPEMIKQITIKEFPKFHNKATTEFHSSLSSFLPIAKDDQWKRIRTTLSPTFSAVKLKEVIPIMDEAANILGEILAEAANSGKYSLLPSFRTGPVFVQKELYLIIFVGHLNLRQPKNSKSKRNLSAINCRFCRAF